MTAEDRETLRRMREGLEHLNPDDHIWRGPETVTAQAAQRALIAAEAELDPERLAALARDVRHGDQELSELEGEVEELGELIEEAVGWKKIAEEHEAELARWKDAVVNAQVAGWVPDKESEPDPRTAVKALLAWQAALLMKTREDDREDADTLAASIRRLMQLRQEAWDGWTKCKEDLLAAQAELEATKEAHEELRVKLAHHESAPGTSDSLVRDGLRRLRWGHVVALETLRQERREKKATEPASALEEAEARADGPFDGEKDDEKA
jgi:DNA repair exonuclease SbcCD ATPase subunit